jgi:hypothetical protein
MGPPVAVLFCLSDVADAACPHRSLCGTFYQLVLLHCTPRTQLQRGNTPNTHRPHRVRHTHTHRVVVKPEMPHLCIDATNNTYTTHAATPRQTRKLSCLIYFRNLCSSAAIVGFMLACVFISACAVSLREQDNGAGTSARRSGCMTRK